MRARPPIRRRFPLLGRHPDYSKALYCDPPSHDFLVWLVIAELMRRYRRVPDPLKVRFALIGGRLGHVDFGPNGILSGAAGLCKIPPGYCTQMLVNVMRPAIDMIGAVEIGPPLDERFDPAVIADYVEYDYHVGHLVDASRAGFEVPRFKAPQWALDEVDTLLGGKLPIVVTLRETEVQPERNSQLDAWLRFAEFVKDDFPILFLRDTAKADEQLPGFPTWPRASCNAYVRMALYSRAYVNMTVSNGPIGWCQFSEAPYLSFKQLVPELPDWDHGNAKGWRDQARMEVGQQYPWASPLQRLTWLDDSFENLSAAFESFRRTATSTTRSIPIARRVPALGPVPDYSCAFYADPPSHDFCVWLIIAELMRRHHGAPAPLKVKFGIVDGQLGVHDFGADSIMSGRSHRCGVTRAYSDRMMANVLRPAIAMMGAVEEPAVELGDHDALGRYVEYDYHIGHLVDAGRQGFEIPRWQPPQWAHEEVKDFLGGSRPPIVITLREVAGNQPERNSRLEEWLKFADSVYKRHPVLFVRDSCRAHELLPYSTWPRASENAFVRAALYQRAYCNLMVCNGPNTWVIFSGAPYLIFKQLIPELPRWDHGNAKGWREQDRMEIGDQYAWATPQQRMTWTDDTYERIAAEFEAFTLRS